MKTMQTAARDLARTLFDDLAAGRTGTVARACSPDVTWWIPLDGADHAGAAAVERALLACVGAEAGRVTLESLIASEDGSTVVVEQSVAREEGVATPATSVLSLEDGRVIAGRTYIDVADWDAAARDGGAQGRRRP
ncbi:MAG: nuclear transport factor 2 family protein [Actinomadura sp.]